MSCRQNRDEAGCGGTARQYVDFFRSGRGGGVKVEESHALHVTMRTPQAEAGCNKQPMNGEEASPRPNIVGC